MKDSIVSQVKIDGLYVNTKWLFRVDTSDIEKMIARIDKQVKLIDKVAILSENIFSAYSIMYYWLIEKEKNEGIKNTIYLLLLFSTVPESLKTYLYDNLNRPTMKLKELSYKTPSDGLAFTTPVKTISPTDFYSLLLRQNINISTEINDLSTYIRVRQDYSLHDLIKQNEAWY